MFASAAIVAGAVALSVVVTSSLAGTEHRGATVDGPHFYMTSAEVAQMRANVLQRKLPWATAAWTRTRAVADDAMGNAPQPADPRRSYNPKGSGNCGDGDDGWWDCLYGPGRVDGLRALALAQAYAITRQATYGDKAREYLVRWSAGYYPPSTQVGHAVSEPVGIALKAFMAFDLVRERLSPAERAQFKAWARALSQIGRQRVDNYMDTPWVPEAPYGNSSTWSRALAVLGASVVGGPYLQDTLKWNWAHTTAGGKDGGWLKLLEGAIETRDGRMTEERVRASIDYALYTWHALALIADAARRVGYPRDLFAARAASGKSLLLVTSYYEPYLTKQRASPHDEAAARPGVAFDSALSEYRAAFEVALRNFPKSKSLVRAVNYGGPATRGANYDVHITGFNGLTGGVLTAPVRR